MTPSQSTPDPGAWFLGVRWWPSADEVSDIHAIVMAWSGYQSPDQTIRRLESVPMRPINQAVYGGFRGGVFDAAAAIAAALAVAHAFPDGNKRVATATALALLTNNGFAVHVGPIALADHVLQIVETSQGGDEAALDVVVGEFAAFLRAG